MIFSLTLLLEWLDDGEYKVLRRRNTFRLVLLRRARLFVREVTDQLKTVSSNYCRTVCDGRAALTETPHMLN